MAITQNIIKVSVEKRFIAAEDYTPIVAGNVGFDFLQLALDAEWEGLHTFVSFAGCYYQPTTCDMAELIEVPWEQITDACELYLGVQGFDPSAEVTIDQEGQLVTNGNIPVLNAYAMRLPLAVQPSGASTGAAPQQPTPSTLQRVEQDLLALEKLTEGADETIARVDAATERANKAADSANAASASVDASKEEAHQAASDANSAASVATKAAAKADTAAGNADKATAAASSAADAANAATSDAITAEEERKQTFMEQLEDWQRQVDVSAVASLMSSVSFGLSDDGDQIAYLPVNPGYAFRLNENNDLEVVA